MCWILLNQLNRSCEVKQINMELISAVSGNYSVCLQRPLKAYWRCSFQQGGLIDGSVQPCQNCIQNFTAVLSLGFNSWKKTQLKRTINVSRWPPTSFTLVFPKPHGIKTFLRFLGAGSSQKKGRSWVLCVLKTRHIKTETEITAEVLKLLHSVMSLIKCSTAEKELYISKNVRIIPQSVKIPIFKCD